MHLRTEIERKYAGLYSDMVYRKTVRRSVHFMRTTHSWGIDKSIVKKLKKAGCLQVEIYEEERGVTLTCPFSEYLKAEESNWGFGSQIFVGQEKFNLKV